MTNLTYSEVLKLVHSNIDKIEPWQPINKIKNICCINDLKYSPINGMTCTIRIDVSTSKFYLIYEDESIPMGNVQFLVFIKRYGNYFMNVDNNFNINCKISDEGAQICAPRTKDEWFNYSISSNTDGLGLDDFDRFKDILEHCDNMWGYSTRYAVNIIST